MVEPITSATSIIVLISMLSGIAIPTCADYGEITRLDIPNDFQTLAIKYDSKLAPSLEKAWAYGAESKRTAQLVDTGLCQYLGVSAEFLEKLGLLTSFNLFYEYFTKTTANYKQARHYLVDVYKFELNQLEGDYQEMEKLGFDIANKSSYENKFYLETENVLLKENVFSKPCTIYDLEAKHKCLENLLKHNTYLDGVSFYNEFIGKSDRSIDLYEQRHKETVKLISETENEFNYLIKDFDVKLKQTDNKIKEFEKNGLLKINEAFIQKIKVNTIKEIEFSSIDSPSIQLMNFKNRKSRISKDKIMLNYERGQNNYLIESLQMINNEVTKLNSLLFEMGLLETNLNVLKQELKDQCDSKLNSMDPSFAIYSEVKELCSEKDNLKEALEDYSTAIKLADEDYSDYDSLILYIEKSIYQMEKLGEDLDYYKNKLSNIKSNTDSVESKYVPLLNLKKSIELRAAPYYADFDLNNKKITSYFTAIEGHNDLFIINSNEFQEDKNEIRLINSKDFLPNSFDVLNAQRKMILKYHKLIIDKASNYFSKNIEFDYFFDKIPECNEKLNTKLVMTINNDLETVSDISFETEIFNQKQTIVIPFFGKGEIYSKEFEQKVVAFTCSEQKTETYLNSFISTIKITPNFKLDQVAVSFSLPEGAIIESCPGICNENNMVYLEGVEEERNVMFSYSLLSEELKETLGENQVDENILVNPTPPVFEIPNILMESINESENKEGVDVNFDEWEIKASLTPLKNLLLDYEKAIDSNVSIPSETFVNNYDDFKESFNEIKLMTGLSIGEFNEKVLTLEDQIKNEINTLKTSAEEHYNRASDYGDNEYLQRALKYYEEGYYTRSIIYSDFASSLKKEDSSFIYLAAFMVIVFSAYLVLRKQSPEKEVEKKIERKLYSFD